MTDSRPPQPAEPDPSLSESVDLAVRRLSLAVVAAGALIGLGVYSQPGPPRFEAFAIGEKIIRVDTRKGTIISCQGQQTCQLILRSGQRLTRVKRSDAPEPPKALPKPVAPTPPAAPPAAEK